MFVTENSSYQVRYVKRNIFISMLELGVLSIVMKYLPIKKAASLKALLHYKTLKKRQNYYLTLFEKEFLRYIDFYRCNNPDKGGKRSKLCRLITMYYLQTLEITVYEDEVFKMIVRKLSNGRVTSRHS